MGGRVEITEEEGAVGGGGITEEGEAVIGKEWDGVKMKSEKSEGVGSRMEAVKGLM